jgi:hypothetical protein
MLRLEQSIRRTNDTARLSLSRHLQVLQTRNGRGMVQRLSPSGSAVALREHHPIAAQCTTSIEEKPCEIAKLLPFPALSATAALLPKLCDRTGRPRSQLRLNALVGTRNQWPSISSSHRDPRRWSTELVRGIPLIGRHSRYKLCTPPMNWYVHEGDERLVA